MKNVLVIDHRDSFVFNLVDELRLLATNVDVIRSAVSLAGVEKRLAEREYDLVLLSPGPGRPEEAGVMLELLQFHPELPFLGVCLGMQAIAVQAGGAVGRAPELVHGRATTVTHSGGALFEGIDTPFLAGRYHSLCVERVPSAMEVLAETADGIPMVIRHRSLPRLGLQFHPESVLTPAGQRFLANALQVLELKGAVR